MLSSIEKEVMLLLYDRCANSPKQIVISLLPKNQLTTKELDKIINNLVMDGYIDVINSNNKGSQIYCVSLKMKGIAFKRELVNQKKNNRYLLGRTVILALISVTITLILRAWLI